MLRCRRDAPTLLYIAAAEVAVHPEHRLVAPNSVRSEALSLRYDEVHAGRLAREYGWVSLGDAEYLAVTLLQAGALVTVDAEPARRADGIVPTAPVGGLSAPFPVPSDG